MKKAAEINVCVYEVIVVSEAEIFLSVTAVLELVCLSAVVSALADGVLRLAQERGIL